MQTFTTYTSGVSKIGFDRYHHEAAGTVYSVNAIIKGKAKKKTPTPPKPEATTKPKRTMSVSTKQALLSGKNIHKAVELYLKSLSSINLSNETKEFFQNLSEKEKYKTYEIIKTLKSLEVLSKNTTNNYSELPFVTIHPNQLNYGGTIDLKIANTIIDIKTGDFNKYTQPLQLAGYAAPFGITTAGIIYFKNDEVKWIEFNKQTLETYYQKFAKKAKDFNLLAA